MRSWTAAALAGQKQIAARLSREGIQLVPDFVYTRTFNGFAAPIDGRALALLERDRDVAGVYPVRAAYPASLSADELRSQAFAPGGGRRPEQAGIPGFDGSGITVALLDTGIDITHPYIRDRLLEGADMLNPEGRAIARPHPDDSTRLERHGTQMAGLIVGQWRPGRCPGCRARRVDPADQSRRLAAERRRRLRRLRPHRPVARRPGAGGRPGRRRRRPGRRAHCRRRCHRAVRLLRGRACGSRRRGRRRARHARRRARRERRARRPRLRQHRRPGWSSGGAHRWRGRPAPARPRRFGSSCAPASVCFSIGSSRWPARRLRARR